MSRTCALCRERAVTCDAIQPICGPCANFGSAIPCDYSSRAAGPSLKSSDLLQKGAACLPCRKKKKKCDAKRPCCTTCKAATKQIFCLYEDDAQRNLIKSLVARTRELEERLASAEQYARDSDSLLPISSVYSEEMSGQFPITLPTDFFVPLHSWKPPLANTPPGNSRPIPRTTLEQFRDFRMHCLSISAYVGLKLSPQATDALVMGDFYSPHVHPSLIHAAQLIGCVMYQDINRMDSLAMVELFELESTLSLLTEDVKPVVALQVHNILCLYHFVRHRYTEGSEQVRIASDLVHRHNMRFTAPAVDTWDPLLEPTHEAEELTCALSHLLYMNIDRYMILGIPSDLGTDYEEEFRSIPMLYPSLSRSNLSILRARSSLLFHRIRQLSVRLRTYSSCPWEAHLMNQDTSSEPAWMVEYWSLLEEVEMNLAMLNPALLKTSLHPHQNVAAYGFKICLVVTLTAEAELHHLAPHAHTESRQHCLTAILKLVGVGKIMTADDYQILDPILGVCWLNAARVMFEESAEPMDDLSAMNWATARSVLVGIIPVLKKSLPYLEVPMNQLLQKAAAFVTPP